MDSDKEGMADYYELINSLIQNLTIIVQIQMEIRYQTLMNSQLILKQIIFGVLL
ncbi:MAG: hypothetical protein ACW981_10570 [Candidatus Hodarchaeales archaeon]